MRVRWQTTKLCNTCEYLRYCARSGIEEVGCDRYKRDTTTNEEWFCRLPTEEKAEFSMRVFKNCTWCLDGGSPQECPFNAFLDCPAESKENMVKWLKEIHHDNQYCV